MFGVVRHALRPALRTAVPASAVPLLAALAGCGGSGAGPAAAVHWPKPPSGAMVVVPRVVGLTPGQAARRMRRAGLALRPGYTGSEGNPSIDANCFEIYTQAVPPGDRRPRGTRVASTQGVCHEAIGPGEARARRNGTGQTFSVR